MSLTLAFCSVLFAAIIWTSEGEAGRLLLPTELTYTWLDSLTVNVSWKEPRNLPHGCKIKYEIEVLDIAGNAIKKIPRETSETHFQSNLFTQNYEFAQWTSSIRTIGSQSCKGWINMMVNKTIRTQKPEAKAVEDFKCYFSNLSNLTCSWKPVKPSLKLSLSYRNCDQYNAPVNNCTPIYTTGGKILCHIEDKNKKLIQQDICIIATTEAGLSTFKAEYALASPKMSISNDGSDLILIIEEIAERHCLRYNICYTECSTHKPCQEYSKNIIKLRYDHRCRYDFKYEVKTDQICRPMRSDWSDATYGVNKPDMTMTVVFIIIPVVLSAFVILSCYCFRRYSDIIFPTIPDPSAIFKEMMMNGNKDIKPTTNPLYSPEEEEQSKITLIAEDSDLHQNS